MKIITILLGKLILFVCKKLGRGSALPGELTYRFNKNILSYFEKPKQVIAVTGSSGKGSTTKIIALVYQNLGYKVAYNSKGSNERSAIITTLLENCTITGKTKVDIAVFEMDERYVKYVFPQFHIDDVIITNITRDQPPRQANFDFVLKEIKKGLDPKIHLYLNGDDPYLRNFDLEDKYKKTYYAIDKQENSYKVNPFQSINISRCPICNATLDYDYYHFEHLGSYKCKNCGFKKEEAKYAITNCDFKEKIITINQKYDIKLNSMMLFHLYNTIAAFAYLATKKIKPEVIAKEIEKINIDEKIYDELTYKRKKVYILNNKNENATTFNQSLLFASQNKGLKTLIIGWWQISRRYDFDDLSWLYDIEFELLKNHKIDKIIVAGPQRYDIAVRLKYANFDTKKILIYNNLYEAKESILKAKGDIYAILNFDYIKPMKDIMKGAKK